MKPHTLTKIVLTLLCAGIGVPTVDSQESVAPVSLADISYIDVAPVYLTGYGIVTGLAGDGDGCVLAHSDSTLAASYRRLGVDDGGEGVRVGCCAAVLVTAQIPAGLCSGSKLDATLTALGDARDLDGGTLQSVVLYARDQRFSVTALGRVTAVPVDERRLTPPSGRVHEAACLNHTAFFGHAPDLEMNIIVVGLSAQALCALVDRINCRFGEIAVPAAPERITICLSDAYSEADDRLQFVLELGAMPVADPMPHWLADEEPLSQQFDESLSPESVR